MGRVVMLLLSRMSRKSDFLLLDIYAYSSEQKLIPTTCRVV